MAVAFTPGNVKIGPGTIYIAPLGTTEPTAVTGAWPTGWVQAGYTEQGSTFSVNPTTGTVDVEEEYYPLRNITTGMVATMSWVFAEATARNALLAINAGLGTPGSGAGNVPGTTGTNPDGSIWVEPPGVNQDSRVMIGWDALGTTGAAGGDPFGRIIARQCYQTGTVAMVARKGNAKRVVAVTFNLDKPLGLQPYRLIYPATLSGV